MLVEFSVENFRSFKNKVTFSMETGSRLRKYTDNVIEFNNTKLVKSSLLFGGNANGKSNLISAIGMLRFLIINPTMSEDNKLITDTFGYNNGNTYFNIKFIIDEDLYEYSLIYNSLEFVFEELSIDKTTIFLRENQDFKILPNQIENLNNNIRKNQNLLFFAQQNNVSDAKKVFSWFLNNLIFVNTIQIPNVLFKLLEEENFKNKFLSFVKAADFNITDVEVRERKIKNSFNININVKEPQLSSAGLADQESTTYDLYLTHCTESDLFKVHFGNESHGTKVFIFLALYILSNENNGKVLLIDEFDCAFHMELAQALLDVFNNKFQKNQYILTTHELSLMDYKLRQDQIWFAEKDQYGCTDLYSVFDFDDSSMKRGDFGYKKRYLEGRFGATPIINGSLLDEVVGKRNE